jgi:hypothetical protein
MCLPSAIDLPSIAGNSVVMQGLNIGCSDPSDRAQPNPIAQSCVFCYRDYLAPIRPLCDCQPRQTSPIIGLRVSAPDKSNQITDSS